jgi:hypothetical protein
LPTGTAVMKRLATMGLDRTFLEGVLRQLRRDKLSASGEKGVGVSSYEWQAGDYATYLCGLAAEGPTTAAATVLALSSLPFAGAYSGSSWAPERIKNLGLETKDSPLTLGVWLAAEIKDLKGLPPEVRAARGADEARATLTLTAHPPRAEVTFYQGSDFYRLVWQHAPKPYPGGNALMFMPDPSRHGLWIDRTAVMPYAILTACADLLASNRKPVAIYHPKGSAPSGAEPEGDTTNENASDLAGSEASIRNSQPRTNATETSDTSEVREDGNTHQVPFGMRGRLPLPSRKDQLQHACHFA